MTLQGPALIAEARNKAKLFRSLFQNHPDAELLSALADELEATRDAVRLMTGMANLVSFETVSDQAVDAWISAARERRAAKGSERG